MWNYYFDNIAAQLKQKLARLTYKPALQVSLSEVGY